MTNADRQRRIVAGAAVVVDLSSDEAFSGRVGTVVTVRRNDEVQVRLVGGGHVWFMAHDLQVLA